MKNEAVLLGHYGDDHRVCNSAWQSTGHSLNMEDLQVMPLRERSERLFIETMKTKKKTPRDLIMMLGEHGHLSPFEKIILDFQVISDIPTHYQMLKHRIGVSINTESGRYRELEDKWLIPEDWPPEAQEKLQKFNILAHQNYHEMVTELTPILGRKRAKESGRFFLPCSKQLTYDVMFNLRSFAHFVKLRADSHAQIEIQKIARSMLKQVYEQHFCNFSLEALGLLNYLSDEDICQARKN